MIAEVLIIGLTVSFVSSLGFTLAFLKKQREWDKEDSKLSEPDPDPLIFPFIKIVEGTPCPKCLHLTKNEVKKKDTQGYTTIVFKAEGLALPKSCAYLNGDNNEHNKCPAKGLQHLHARCNTCRYKWFMAPADSKTKPKPIEEPVENIAIPVEN